jgi:D-beta-D-heptose 7-phosphate kinase/D-beta-D-heptose 1-phosphate adenosyltransferase
VGNFSEALYKKVVDQALAALPKVQVVVLSDYGKGLLHPEYVIKPLMAAALKQGIPVIVDPKGSDYTIYKGATVITPNRKELQEATLMATKTDEEVILAAKSLQKNAKIQNVLATRSEEGMTLVNADGKVAHFRAVPREVYDVSGAGDTVVATLAVGLGYGLPLEQAVHLANLAGTIVVGKIGTATVSLEELEEALRQEDLDSGYSKIMALSGAQDQVKKWHKKGLKVGFTNGCFDLLHLGHLAILRKSRKECDRLIVAVNADSSVKKLKGETRPIQNQETRTEILAALSFVDLVVIFSEDTPYNLIKALEPDVLVKGADYTVDKVVGADLVLKRGGRVVLVDLEEGHSTTNTVKRINSTPIK